MLSNFFSKYVPKGNTKQSCKQLQYLMAWKSIYDLVVKFLQSGLSEK